MTAGPRAPRTWRTRPDKLEECTEFTPGQRYPGHQSGMVIRWLLRGPDGAATFRLYTGWLPGRPRAAPDGSGQLSPWGGYLAYHARRPMHEAQQASGDHCPVIGGACYYDRSAMRAEYLIPQFTLYGEYAVWAELERVCGLLATAAAAAPAQAE